MDLCRLRRLCFMLQCVFNKFQHSGMAEKVRYPTNSSSTNEAKDVPEGRGSSLKC